MRIILLSFFVRYTNICNDTDITIDLQVTFDDGVALSVNSYTDVAGGFVNGAPENVNYSINNYEDRSPTGWYNSGINRDGVGFSFNLNPGFSTDRTLLRIHPDGNNEGTLGCIGLSGDGNHQLRSFRDNVSNRLLNDNSIPVNINIQNNPNKNGRNRTTRIPNIRE